MVDGRWSMAYAQEQYYRKAEGLRGTQLKAVLHDIIQPEQVLDYGGGAGKTWSGFWLTDQMDDMQVRDRYSNIVRHFNPDMSAVSNMNIEHIWANSWWGHVKNNAYCDLFNLYPADATANGRKSNNPIGIVDGTVATEPTASSPPGSQPTNGKATSRVHISIWLPATVI